jgi:plasmid stabilization system protein ParE
MSEGRNLIVEYSKQSLDNASEIIVYLRMHFTEKEVSSFYQTLQEFEKIVRLFPNLYPESKKRRVRRAVLSRELSVYYAIKNNNILIVAIFDNRWDEATKI